MPTNNSKEESRPQSQALQLTDHAWILPPSLALVGALLFWIVKHSYTFTPLLKFHVFPKVLQ